MTSRANITVAIGLCIAASVAFARCGPVAVRQSAVARAQQVPASGDAEVDRFFRRVRAMQVAINESDRQYLDALATLGRALRTNDDELGTIATSLRTSADQLRERGKLLTVGLDTAPLEALLAPQTTHEAIPVVDGGIASASTTGCDMIADASERDPCRRMLAQCDRFEDPNNVLGCHRGLTRGAIVVIREHPARVLDEDEEQPPESSFPETTEAFARATAVTIAELASIRIRMQAITRAAPILDHERLPLAARYGPTHRLYAEFVAAHEVLDSVPARARVQSRYATQAAELLASSLQRIAR